MSKGKKYKIPHKYLSKYPVRKRDNRYKVMGGKKKTVKKQKSLSTLDTRNSGRP